MTIFNEGDVVELTHDIKELGLRKGQVGAILMAFQEPQIAYEIEFADTEGRTIAQTTLQPEQIKPYGS